MEFVGRDTDLSKLSDQLDEVVRTRQGRFVLVRGRRRVGKSRMVEEFLRRGSTPAIYFTASRQPRAAELVAFARAAAQSDVPGADLLGSMSAPGSWEDALEAVAALASSAGPLILVVDEFPYLAEGEDGKAVEGTFQKVWDRVLQRLPILLVVIGSDLSAMRALTDYDRPLYGRPTATIHVRPFSPLEVGQLTGLEGRAAIDAYAVVGGFPFVAGSWRRRDTVATFLERSLTDPSSPLIVDGERMLAVELPPSVPARRVLSAIGGGDRTFTGLSRAAELQHTSLSRALETLVDDKRMVAVDSPLSARLSRNSLYRVADPYLRFWLTFVEPALPDVERDRGELVARQILERWPDYLESAVEPIVRESVERLLPDERFGAGAYAGRYWTRTGATELDLVVGERPAAPTDVSCVGSIKWRTRKRFDRRDTDALARAAAEVPGTTPKTRLFGVSAAGFASSGLDVELDPDELLAAWAPHSA
ncbi:MAG: ATP-binding protein [Thermoleophilaceae bacterium]